MQFASMIGPLMAGMGDSSQEDALNAQLQGNWQGKQLDAATSMANQANQGFVQQTANTTNTYAQSNAGQQNALAQVVEGFRNSLLSGIRR